MTDFIAFGEALVRLAPASSSSFDASVNITRTSLSSSSTSSPSSASSIVPAWMSLGGDELNVCVDLARMGCNTTYVTVVGDDPAGRWIQTCAQDANVDLAHIVTLPSENTGSFTVVPEEKKVSYYRKRSAFQQHDPASTFSWPSILRKTHPGRRTWLHLTGITPLLSANALQSWRNAMECALALHVPVSLDVNHRPQLGSFGQLWQIILPYVSSLYVLVLAKTDVVYLCSLYGLDPTLDATSSATSTSTSASTASSPSPFLSRDLGSYPEDDGVWLRALLLLAPVLRVKLVVLCLKTRTQDGVQTRWSIATMYTPTPTPASSTPIIDAFTTERVPTVHVPKDDLGGGSAFFAGLMDFIIEHNLFRAHAAALGDLPIALALRRADLTAALCQETIGDFACTSRVQLASVEALFSNRVADLRSLQTEHPHLVPTEHCRLRAAPTPAGSLSPLTSLTSPPLPLSFAAPLAPSARTAPPTSAEAQRRIAATMDALARAGVVAIIRGSNAAQSLVRAEELVAMRCRAIEVTLDTPGVEQVLQALPGYIRASRSRSRSQAGHKAAFTTAAADAADAVFGVGTVFHSFQVEIAARLGAQFALSPINPAGFVDECAKWGVVACPGVYTPNEIWAAHTQGAPVIKLFPAQLWSPSVLKALLAVGDLAAVKVLVSGGVSPANWQTWIINGAFGVGMGTELAGSDIKVQDATSRVFAEAHTRWREKDRAVAQAIFDTANAWPVLQDRKCTSAVAAAATTRITSKM